MTDHAVKVESLLTANRHEPRWRAVCFPCAWNGSPRQTRLFAEADALEHRHGGTT